MISVSDINAVLQAEDIEGLLQLGAPTDEYVYEAEKIHAALAECGSSEGSVAAVVTQVWARSFDLSEGELAKRSQSFHRVASQLLALEGRG